MLADRLAAALFERADDTGGGMAFVPRSTAPVSG